MYGIIVIARIFTPDYKLTSPLFLVEPFPKNFLSFTSSVIDQKSFKPKLSNAQQYGDIVDIENYSLLKDVPFLYYYTENINITIFLRLFLD